MQSVRSIGATYSQVAFIVSWICNDRLLRSLYLVENGIVKLGARRLRIVS